MLTEFGLAQRGGPGLAQQEPVKWAEPETWTEPEFGLGARNETLALPAQGGQTRVGRRSCGDSDLIPMLLSPSAWQSKATSRTAPVAIALGKRGG